MNYRVHTTTGGITQRFHAGNVTQRLNKRRQHRAVADQFAIQPQLLTQVKDSRPVVAERAANQ